MPRTRQHAPRRKEPHGTSASHRDRQIASASPEVISSLITSLSVLSKPSSSDLDLPAATSGANLAGAPPGSPRSPTTGSFGVDYGAFSSTNLVEVKGDNVALDELAASPPVIRTAKPPSGFSPLTAPKSPARESSGSGLKSILGGRSASRPSSKGSLASKDADAQSIGNVSIERGRVSPSPELKRRPSLDSWGKKTGRSTKGLMYMSSKERLREREAERKRASIGAVGGGRLSNDRATEPRPDPFLAETPISEEPHGESPSQDKYQAALDNGQPSPRPIPTRESSLRKTGPNAKRSSRRSSKRNSESTDIILELEEQAGSSKAGHRERRKDKPAAEDSEANMGPELLHNRSHLGRVTHPWDKPLAHSFTTTDEDLEDGAPFPAVAQRRRREESVEDRRRAGGQTGDASDASKVKRNGSKLKRLSSPSGPRNNERLNSITANANRNSDVPTLSSQVGYERPQSADSIDDAVESYLCSPRLSQKIRHPQTGRVISFSEVGDSEGSAVFCCVGMGLTRYITAFYDELALTLKLRLITPDRPGVGDSEAYADGTATPLSWPGTLRIDARRLWLPMLTSAVDDVYAICQALKITKFSILAHSAGAIYALATALRMPQHIRGRIHLLAPWIPPSQMSVFGASAHTPLPPTNAIPTSQRILRALPTPFLKAANSSFMTATSSSITSSLPKTPKRKRKSTANLSREREKDAQKAPPLPADNKENFLKSEPPQLPPILPGKDTTPMEDMDRIRPSGTTPTSTAPLSAAVQEAAHGDPRGTAHKKSPSTASAAHAAREGAVLAAAANAMADRERQATYDTRLTHAIWELATTGANPAVDLLVCLERRHTIGFRYVDITRPVTIHHGSRDTRVPVENVKWLGKTMRRCEVRVLEGEGHGLMASAVVMGGVLMEIAKEWEDWGRLTGVSSRAKDREGDRVRRGTVGPVR